jgi:hypothetical protein
MSRPVRRLPFAGGAATGGGGGGWYDDMTGI